MSMIINPSRFAIVGGGGGGTLERLNDVTPHKAWRVNLQRLGGYSNLREIGFWSIDFEDLVVTKGGTAFSSGNFGGYPPSQHFDRNMGSISSLNPAVDPWVTGWIFPTPQPVFFVMMTDHEYGFSVQWSDDTTDGLDGTWTTGGGYPNGYRASGHGGQFLANPAAFVPDGHGAARYYRFLPMRSPSGYSSASKCRFLEGGVDVMGAGVATGRGYNGGYPPSQFFSEDDNFGINSVDGDWIMYMQWDFGAGQAFDVDGIAWKARADAFGASESPQKFAIACSNDLATWYWTWYYDVGTPMTNGELRSFNRP